MSALSYWKDKLATRKHKRDRAAQMLAYRERLVATAREKVAVLRKREKSVKWALGKVGIKESPPDSNRGPEIDVWQREFGMLGQPWCGAFVGYALHQADVPVTNRIVYTPYIKQDAEAGRNGFAKLVPLAQAERGDLILMDFVPGGAPVMHVGMARGKYDSKTGLIPTVEGNTSSGTAGSQSNGGGVFRRSRPASVIVGVARPRWK